MRTNKATIAICYDFDGTLIEGNMQENSFIPKLKQSKEAFWGSVKKRAEDHDMDEVLAYMQIMLEKASEEKVSTKKKALKAHGKKLNFFIGVKEWFDLIDDYVNNKPVKIQHFIISSGIDEMIKGSEIGKKFKHIFASGFYYDVNDVAIFPARSINYTTKVQYLFRINKGVLNSWKNKSINKTTDIKDRPIPFPRMIYIGDGETDVPAMKMLNHQGGYSVVVYPPKKSSRTTKKEKKKMENAKKLVADNRAHYCVQADYSKDSELYKVATALIDCISNEVETSMNLNASGWDIPNPQIQK